jgi:hypothetical protein
MNNTLDSMTKDQLVTYARQQGYTSDILDFMKESMEKRSDLTLCRFRRGNPSGVDFFIGDNITQVINALNGPLMEWVKIRK